MRKPGLTLSQEYALRACLGASRCMLIKQGRSRYSTEFVGGTRINRLTVESLVASGLMAWVSGGPSVTLTQNGVAVARGLKLEVDQAEAAARARTAHTNEKYRRHMAARRAERFDPAAEPAPARRLPYADN